jgi:hypothetical protein
MKNVFLILMLFGGFAIAGLQAQNCQPCPPCPACPKGCCMGGGNKAASASAQLMPATLDLTGTCSPTAMAACQDGKKMSKKEMKACQASCMSAGTPSCQSSAANTFQPSSVAVVDKTQEAPKPEKN